VLQGGIVGWQLKACSACIAALNCATAACCGAALATLPFLTIPSHMPGSPVEAKSTPFQPFRDPDS
jgi:hypothetical protein